MEILRLFPKVMLAACLLEVSVASASPAMNFTLKNGSGMPISPGVFYVTATDEPLLKIGDAPTPGFVELCQTGTPDRRILELKNDSHVVAVIPVQSAIAPGESVAIQIPGMVSSSQALHYEAMYGKTKDSCATVSVTGEQLMSVKPNRSRDFHSEEKVLASGNFLDPAVAASTQCSTTTMAVDCLRELAAQNPAPKIRHFPGYLPSVMNFIESKYGSAETQALIVPTGGALSFTLHRH